MAAVENGMLHMINLDRSKRNTRGDEDQAALIKEILFPINPDGHFSGQAKRIFRVGAYQADDLVAVTDPGAVNNLVRIAAPEPGAIYGKEVLKAVLIDFHHMG